MVSDVLNSVVNGAVSRAVVRAKVRALKLRKCNAVINAYQSVTNEVIATGEVDTEKVDAGITNVVNILENIIGNVVENGGLAEANINNTDGVGAEQVDTGIANVKNIFVSVIESVQEKNGEMEVINTDDHVAEAANSSVVTSDLSTTQVEAGITNFVKNILDCVIGNIERDLPVELEEEVTNGCTDDDGCDGAYDSEGAIADDDEASIGSEEKIDVDPASDRVTQDEFDSVFGQEDDQVRWNFC